MRLLLVPTPLSVCKISDTSLIRWDDEYIFLSKADGELSLVCSSACVPPNAVAIEDGWRALRFEGTLDFSMVGVLAKIAAVLAGAGISIFAVSTYDTDYVLIKAGKLDLALVVLESAGYEIS